MQLPHFFAATKTCPNYNPGPLVYNSLSPSSKVKTLYHNFQAVAIKSNALSQLSM